jgi:hypothetical protein
MRAGSTGFNEPKRIKSENLQPRAIERKRNAGQYSVAALSDAQNILIKGTIHVTKTIKYLHPRHAAIGHKKNYG